MDEARRLGGDGGFALVEVLVTVALLGLAVTGILGAFWATISLSGVHRQQAQAGTVLASAAEYVRAEPHVRCDRATPTPEDAYRDAAQRALREDWSGSIAISGIQYWDGNAWQASCPNRDARSLDYLSLQLVTVEVRAPEPDGRTVRSVSVVKSEDD